MWIERVYNWRTIALTIILIVGYYVLNIVRPSIGIRLYAISLILLVGIIIPVMWWQVRKTFPVGGIGATSERDFPVQYSFEHVCTAVAGAAKDLGWRLIETNAAAGHFRYKIGRTIRTSYGQSITIDVRNVDRNSCKVNVVCSALYSMMDFGGNNDSIERFRNRLMMRLP
jgi:hypothetical protein